MNEKDEDTLSGRARSAWPLSTDEVSELLTAMSENELEGSPLMMAVLEALINAGGSLNAHELAARLSADYDGPPTDADVLKVHMRHQAEAN